MADSRALAVTIAIALAALPGVAHSQQAKKPNILVIMGGDIGYWNISAYNRGMMGYRTPNIDRLAREGALFTDLYAQQSWSSCVHHRPVPLPHGPAQGGFARRQGRTLGAGPDARREARPSMTMGALPSQPLAASEAVVAISGTLYLGGRPGRARARWGDGSGMQGPRRHPHQRVSAAAAPVRFGRGGIEGLLWRGPCLPQRS